VQKKEMETMRRVLVSLVLSASLAVIGAGSALAWNQDLPTQACAGTARAGVIGNQVVPSLMDAEDPGSCMNMPTLHPNS
jgi:hypothetical protein